MGLDWAECGTAPQAGVDKWQHGQDAAGRSGDISRARRVQLHRHSICELCPAYMLLNLPHTTRFCVL